MVASDGGMLFRMRLTRACFAILLPSFAAFLPAQTTLVSPAFYVNEEGTTTASLPFGSPSLTGGYPLRSQQVIGGLRGQPRVFRSLSFRRDGQRAASTLFDQRSVDLELFAGHGNYASASSTFASNYTAPRQQVSARRAFSVPGVADLPRVVPAPFSVRIAFDAPFVFSGAADFVWEAGAASQLAGPGTLTPVDAAISGMNIVMPSGYQMNGRGCNVPPTSLSEMQLRSAGSLQNFPVNAWILAFSATNAPPNAGGALLLGLANPNAPVPGLCANLFVTPMVTVPSTVPASGPWLPLGHIAPSPRIPYLAALVGMLLETQAAALDPTQPFALKVAASNGVSVRLNDWTPAFQVAQISEVGTATGTGTLSTTVAVVVELGL
jgi:hypothetical protein